MLIPVILWLNSRHVLAEPPKKSRVFVSASVDASVDLAVGHHHFTIDYLLPCIHWPGEATSHACQGKWSIDQYLFLNISSSGEVRSSSPTNPTCSVQEHESWGNDATFDARFTCCNDSWQSVRFSTKSLTIHILTSFYACLFLGVPIPNC